ncbi:MAG: class I SAM-dependent methyltransferase [Muribaculaceae bacterium]|nr:class I SAM-dependent methyltransferase [Muribaculaceae bacterium]
MKPDLEIYIENHISPEPENLKKIDRITNLYHINGRMCSGHIQGRLLKMITSMIRPKRVIELGTFTGYSALCIAEALDEDATIDTVEADDELEEEIMTHLNSSPHGRKVNLHIGDALKVLENWNEEVFDLALIDADKRQYPQYFEKILKIVKPGGFIIADNTLWDGHVTEAGKHSSQTKGIMDFNDLVALTPEVEVAIIPMRDGITIIRKVK